MCESFFGNPTIVGSWQNTLNLSSFITISLILKLRVFSRSWFRVPTRLFFWPWKSFTSKEKNLKRNTWWYAKIQSTSSPSDRWIHSDLCMDIDDDIPNKLCWPFTSFTSAFHMQTTQYAFRTYFFIDWPQKLCHSWALCFFFSSVHFLVWQTFA